MKHKKKETGQVCTGEKKKEGWKLHSIQGMEQASPHIGETKRSLEASQHPGNGVGKGA